MAIVKSSVFDKARGSFGNVTLVDYGEGESIMKAKSDNPHNPRTAAQQAQRSIFGLIILMGKVILGFLQQNYRSLKPRWTAWNAFCSQSLKVARAQGLTTLHAIATKVDITNGSLFKVALAVGVVEGAPSEQDAEVNITWDFDGQAANQNSADDMVMLTFNVDTETYSEKVTGTRRVDGAVTVNIAQPATGTNYFAVFFRSPIDGSVSTEKVFASWTAGQAPSGV